MQNKLASLKDDQWTIEKMSYLPQSEKIKPFLLGFHTTFANYLWIRTMLYFGTHYETDRDFTYLVTMLDIITKLNPYFYPAYEFAGIMIPTFTGDYDAAQVLLNRGINYMGNRKYTIPFYLGWLYYSQYKDFEATAYYMAYAAKNPQAPVFISKLAATMYENANQSKVGLNFLYSVYYSTENELIKKTIEEKIKSYLKEVPD